MSEKQECEYCEAFQWRDWQTVEILQDEGKGCTCSPDLAPGSAEQLTQLLEDEAKRVEASADREPNKEHQKALRAAAFAYRQAASLADKPQNNSDKPRITDSEQRKSADKNDGAGEIERFEFDGETYADLSQREKALVGGIENLQGRLEAVEGERDTFKGWNRENRAEAEKAWLKVQAVEAERDEAQQGWINTTDELRACNELKKQAQQAARAVEGERDELRKEVGIGASKLESSSSHGTSGCLADTASVDPSPPLGERLIERLLKTEVLKSRLEAVEAEREAARDNEATLAAERIAVEQQRDSLADALREIAEWVETGGEYAMERIGEIAAKARDIGGPEHE